MNKTTSVNTVSASTSCGKCAPPLPPVLSDIPAIDTAIYDIQLALELSRQRCDVLRRTSDELKLWSRTGGKEGIHPVHAANRIAKVAHEIDGSQGKEGNRR